LLDQKFFLIKLKEMLISRHHVYDFAEQVVNQLFWTKFQMFAAAANTFSTDSKRKKKQE